MRTSAGEGAALGARSRRGVLALLLAVVLALAATIGLAWTDGAGAATANGKIVAVGAESQYADVIRQVGGE
jgi:hypothetical protein